ncbi:MAG: hypothetical protein KDI68_13695 [Gammaproteobacteria bacterium]|nr:hypothetical protein [Gammaproteobacteria bacterium]
MQMNRSGTALVFLLTLLLAAGCQSLQRKQSNIDLEKVLNSYHTTVRWGQPQECYSFLKPGVLAADDIPFGLDNIRVTGYEVIRPPTPISETEVEQTARISYVLQDRQIQRTLTDTQRWEYNKEQRLWFRINPPPRYK